MTHKEIQIELKKHHEIYVRHMEETSIQRVLERVNQLLFSSHLTQSQIAKEAGMNRQTIHKLVKGQRDIHSMKLDTLMKLDKVAMKHIEL